MRGLGWVFRHPRVYRWSLALARRLQQRLASGPHPWTANGVQPWNVSGRQTGLASGAQPCTVGGSPPETPSGSQPQTLVGAQTETPFGSPPDTSGGSQGIVADPGWIRNLPGYAAGWTLGRDVPPLPPRSFREWWEEDRRSLTRLP